MQIMDFPRVPSMYAHVLNAVLLLAAVILALNHYRTFRPYEKVVVALLFSIGMGVHGLSHLGLEKAYNFNPLQN
jgi:hypothetical protein